MHYFCNSDNYKTGRFLFFNSHNVFEEQTQSGQLCVQGSQEDSDKIFQNNK